MHTLKVGELLRLFSVRKCWKSRLECPRRQSAAVGGRLSCAAAAPRGAAILALLGEQQLGEDRFS